MIDVVMCLKNPDFAVLAQAIQRIRREPEVQRLIFVIYPTLQLIDFIHEQMQEGDECLWDSTGLAYARWIGIQASKADFLSFVDHDTLIPRGFYTHCLRYFGGSQIGAVNGISIDTDSVRHGLKTMPTKTLQVISRGLCTANVIRRSLVADWRPPKNLQALEDFHLTHHLATKGYMWLQIPRYVLHYSCGEDFVKRWLWNGAGIRMIQGMGLGDALPLTMQSRSIWQFLWWRLICVLVVLRYAKKHGLNARAIQTEIHRQFCFLKGYLQAEKYLKSRRTGYERAYA